MTKTLLALLLLFAAPALFAARPDTTTVASVDLPRFMGRWYVISHVPNLTENGKVGTYDQYSLRQDGAIAITFVFRHGSLDAKEKEWNGHGWVMNTATNAEWKVRIHLPIAGIYRVVELDPDYRWAVICTTSGKLVWVMARATSLDEATYAMIVERLARRGLPTDKLQRVPQLPP
jgi:apolipoprotein D and lipocalin family protein